MKALLWKDFRINLPIAVAAGVVWGIIHGFAVVILFGFGHVPFDSLPHWSGMLTSTNLTSLAFSQLLVGALGANAIASERTDRSAEFLFALPPTRGQILTSKLIVALLLALGVWITHLFMLEVIVPLFGNYPGQGFPRREGFYPMAFASAVCLFGGSWLGSSLLKSAAYSLLVGVALAGSAVGVLFNIQKLLKLPDSPALDHSFQATFLVLGVAAFAAGSIYFLRRIEP